MKKSVRANSHSDLLQWVLAYGFGVAAPPSAFTTLSYFEPLDCPEPEAVVCLECPVVPAFALTVAAVAERVSDVSSLLVLLLVLLAFFVGRLSALPRLPPRPRPRA